MTSCIPTNDGRDITPEDDEHIAWVNSGFRAGYEKAQRESFYEVFGSSKASQSKEHDHKNCCPHNCIYLGNPKDCVLLHSEPPQPNTDSLEVQLETAIEDLWLANSEGGKKIGREIALSSLKRLFNKYAMDAVIAELEALRYLFPVRSQHFAALKFENRIETLKQENTNGKG